jgi:hypothetical protein
MCFDKDTLDLLDDQEVQPLTQETIKAPIESK